MNYLILQNIINSLITSFSCKNCNSKVGPADLNILWIAGNSLNLEAICPSCKTPWVIKAEIWLVTNLSNPEFMKNAWPLLDVLKKWMENLSINWAIKEEDINKVKENLKNCNSIEDLLK